MTETNSTTMIRSDSSTWVQEFNHDSPEGPALAMNDPLMAPPNSSLPMSADPPEGPALASVEIQPIIDWSISPLNYLTICLIIKTYNRMVVIRILRLRFSALFESY